MLTTVNNDNSFSAFSDCNSDRSAEFSTPSSETRRLLIACAADNSDEFIPHLVLNLHSCSIEDQKQATMEIRLLAKNKEENRVKIAKAGAIKPLVSLLSSSSDLQLQEYVVTAILNLSLCDENKDLINSSGAVEPLVVALETGTPTAKENAACALLRLSRREEDKVAIGRAGAIPPLVKLLEGGGLRGKKDAATALYAVCSAKENKVRAVRAGVMRALVELMADLGSSMVDKAVYVVSVVVGVVEGRAALVDEGGIPVLVEIVEVGTQRQKEIAVGVLLQICEESWVYRTMVAREGAIPPLVAFSQSQSHSHSNRPRHKRGSKLKLLFIRYCWCTWEQAEKLIELLRQPRSGNGAGRS
ncbi:U-box domain-containing protein 4 isoform X1 [Vigna radiata var. radiata]|uniref:U-box domain-containing protein 4 isoform X1 n=1 Tax=Vigna radiata var. radiata TaxID=3916 RepID=A0A3Q0EY52_VIGRR|nr:U-box domain-containing protein 4 isoform X1 [Vigna radiata var. radiata]